MLRHSFRRLDLSRARASNKTVALDGIRAGDYCETRTAASSHQQRLAQPEGSCGRKIVAAQKTPFLSKSN